MTPEARQYEILLIEDSQADAELVRQALTQYGIWCVLHVVRDGERAIELINGLDQDAKSPPLDLILVDMYLPKHSGEEVLKCLRTTERYARTPVVAMTAYHSSHIEEQATKYAALFYFRKPSGLDQFMALGAVVRRLLAVNQQNGDSNLARDDDSKPKGAA